MTIKIPSSSADIKIKDYVRYRNYIVSNPNATQDQINRKAIGIFCHLERKQADVIPQKDFVETINLINAALTQEPEKLIMKWNGLGFIPNLDLISSAAYADLETYWNDDETTLIEVMNCLYRPIKTSVLQDYEIEDYTDEIHPKIKDMPLSIAKSAIGFFLTLRDDLLACTLRYSEQAVEANQQQT